jgi:2-phosphosulfolactate phosphatase
MSFAAQTPFDVRCEWGPGAVDALAGCRTFIVVDVLSFSTSVSIATARKAIVFPYRWNDSSAVGFAGRQGALLAGARGDGYSLSPESLLAVPAGARIVLPSPNGSTIALQAGSRGGVLAGCLRSRAAVCARAVARGGCVAIVAAGERWPDGALRPALEDLLGAGAIAAGLPGSRSPEAEAAVAVFESMASRLAGVLPSCVSGRELVERGFSRDVELAAALDVDDVAPELVEGAFRAG